MKFTVKIWRNEFLLSQYELISKTINEARNMARTAYAWHGISEVQLCYQVAGNGIVTESVA